MRIKRGIIKKQKHKRLLKLAKGYRMTYSKSYRRAKEAVLHAKQYSYNHRRRRKSQIRAEWIKIISSGLSQYGVSYSKFMHYLKMKDISLNRKILAEIIINSPSDFQNLVSALKN